MIDGGIISSNVLLNFSSVVLSLIEGSDGFLIGFDGGSLDGSFMGVLHDVVECELSVVILRFIQLWDVLKVVNDPEDPQFSCPFNEV